MISDRTKYSQLQTALKGELLSGRFKEGDRFYTEKEIMARYKVSSVTVARALREMTESGYFERRRKLGTFVLGRTPAPGMRGEVMVRPLFINRTGLEKDGSTGTDQSWFVVEEIRRGIINSYPGMVKIVDLPDILAEAEKDPDLLAVLFPSRIENYDRIPKEKIRSFVKIFLPPQTGEPCNCICPEYMTGVIDAVFHLVQLGHRRIAYIGTLGIKKRYAAYRIALESNELAPVPELIRRGDDLLAYRGGADAMKELLALPEDRRPTAVFCATDKHAIGAVRAVTEAGLRVPEDISVVGFDDIEEARDAVVPLSTVHVPYFEIGKMAVELLLDKLRQGRDIPSRSISARYVLRDSTAQVKKEAPRS